MTEIDPWYKRVKGPFPEKYEDEDEDEIRAI